MALREVVGTLHQIDDTPWPVGVITFTLKVQDHDDVIQYLPDEKTAIVQSDGTFSIELWCNAVGAGSVPYTIKFPDGSTDDFFLEDGVGAFDIALRPAGGWVGGGGSSTGPVGPAGPAGPTGATGAAGTGVPAGGSTAQVLSKINGTDFNTQWSFLPVEQPFAVSDETTALTTGTAKLTFRMPSAMTLTEVRSNINTVSSSGLVTVDIKLAGTTIFSTLLSIDVGEETSVTATTPAVISTTSLPDDAEMTVDITAAGTGAKGLKITLKGHR